MSSNSNPIEEKSSLTAWYNPPKEKIPGIALAVTAVSLAVFATLITTNVFGASAALHFVAIGLAVSSIPVACTAAYLLRPAHQHTRSLGSLENIKVEEN